MQEIVLNGREMRDKKSAHEAIAAALGFPQYYGNNLDALWDMLTTIDEMSVTLTDSAAMLNALGAYGCKLIETFYEAAAENPRLRFALLEDFDPDAIETENIPEEP